MREGNADTARAHEAADGSSPSPGRAPGGADLHAHTTASDGLLSPQALCALAVDLGLTALAITDHDTAAGVRALRAGYAGASAGAAVGGPLEVIAGIEVSSGLDGADVHILGYGIDPDDERILAFEAERGALRRRRLERMVEALCKRGLEVTMAEVDAQIGGHGVPGRPHLARALVARGHARDARDCFDRLFAAGGPGYVPYERIAPREAVELIASAGGVAVVAHAGLDGVEAHLDALVEAGIEGVEVWHASHDAAQAARLDGYARERGLARTGGSDFHGLEQKEGARLGAVTCPAACLEDLRERMAASRARAEAAAAARAPTASSREPHPTIPTAARTEPAR